MHWRKITQHSREKPPHRTAYACNGNIAEIGFNEIFVSFLLTFFGFPVSSDVSLLFTCGRDEKGGIRRLHPLGHGEVGQVGEGDEEGEGGDTVCYGH